MKQLRVADRQVQHSRGKASVCMAGGAGGGGAEMYRMAEKKREKQFTRSDKQLILCLFIC